MTRLGKTTWKTMLLVVALALALSAAAHAGEGEKDDESVVLRRAVRLRDCPEVKVLGAGHARVLALSPHGFLGVEASSLTPELRRHFGVPEDAGVMLSRVLEGSAAAAAGLAVGDVVTRVDGEAITSANGLGRAIRHQEGGAVVDIEYWRDGARYETRATLEERERCSFDIGDSLRAIELEDLPELGALGLEVGGEAMETALEALREAMESQDWQQHFEHLKVLDLDDVEERMGAVQEKLEEIEKRLEREYGDDLERAEEMLERTEQERLEAERDRARAERDRARAERDRAEREGGADVH